MPALALTDHNNVSGAVQFYREAKKRGIKPIQGAEITLENGAHLTLLAQNQTGYANLCRVISAGYRDGKERTDPRVPLRALQRFREGIIALSGCARKGEIPRWLHHRKYQEAEQAACRLVDIFGRHNFYLELQEGYLPGEKLLNQRLAELADRVGVKTVATNNVHYARKADFVLHDLLTCVRTLTRLDEVHPERRLNAENYLKNLQEMPVLGRQYPEALSNTLAVAERCAPVLDFDAPLFPSYPLPAGKGGRKVIAADLLEKLVYAGAHRRYRTLTPSIERRLRHELDIIHQLGYEDYFLVMWDIVRFARREGIRCSGRGSAADSAVAYCLGITGVDAIERGLLFERFLSLERAQPPDIDIDFDARYRDRVAEYVYRKYGQGHVASVCTFNTYRARSALRDLGKVLGYGEETLDRLAKRFPHVRADQIQDCLQTLPELKGDRSLARFQPLFDLCHRVANLPRFIGTHLGGLVVSRVPLENITPLQPSAKGVLITQFDKEGVEDLGLLKLDLLSLRTLSVVEDTMKSINCQQPHLSYESIPDGDPATYRLLNSGNTIGTFQLESPAQRALQAKLGARNLEDLVASVALIRPGPIKGNMVGPFIARRQGKEPVTFAHPKLKPILEKTYGVILFQEQVIEIATTLAGFTPGEADRLRRVMTHGRSSREMEEIGEIFVQKAVENGVEEETARKIFSSLSSYASYGFCEAHAAAFADIAYKTAYLLCHYPAHFYAALLSNQPMGFYSPNTICLEARRRGIKILPLDINQSEGYFAAGERSIRVSLRQVKGMTGRALEKILSERVKQPFRSLFDFCRRCRPEVTRDLVENLILAGAFETLCSNRRHLFWSLESIWRQTTVRRTGQVCSTQVFPLVPWTGPGETTTPRMPKDVIGKEGNWASPSLTDFSPLEKARYELEILGLSPCYHPMDLFRQWAKKQGFLTAAEVKKHRAGKPVVVCGLVIRPHRPPTRSGRTVVFLSLEDETGLVDVTVFEPVYHRYGRLIFGEAFLTVYGRVDIQGQGVSIIAKRFERINSEPTF